MSGPTITGQLRYGCLLVFIYGENLMQYQSIFNSTPVIVNKCRIMIILICQCSNLAILDNATPVALQHACRLCEALQMFPKSAQYYAASGDIYMDLLLSRGPLDRDDNGATVCYLRS
jgi:hypothetical protein